MSLRPSRTRAWDKLFELNNHVFLFGASSVDHNRARARLAIERLSDTTLSIEQIELLADVIYHAYELGKGSNP